MSPAAQTQNQHSATRPYSTTPLEPPPAPAPMKMQLPPFKPSMAALRTPQQQDVRSPSPNYFGLIVDPAAPRESGVGPQGHWSPPTSSIRSFGGIATPHAEPVGVNSDFEAFKRQSESNHGFNLSHGNLTHFASSPGPSMIRPKAQARPESHEKAVSPKSPYSASLRSSESMDAIARDTVTSTQASPTKHSPLNQSLASPNAVSFFDMPRQASPLSMSFAQGTSPVQRNPLSHFDDRHPRLSLPGTKPSPPSPQVPSPLHPRISQPRADTLPNALESGPTMIAPIELKSMMDRLSASQFLLIDLRVFPQFSKARIKDALNLCIPTTLLKRPSFNLKKLQDTFGTEAEKARFGKWTTAECIVVYDAFSEEKKDATSAVNTLRKFTAEGWTGNGYILRGGFVSFSKNYSQYIDDRSSQDVQSSKISLSLGTSMPEVAPVAGGCMMPATKNAANPFFSNIRQNQDLISGVGQMDVTFPENIPEETLRSLPSWLTKIAAKDDHGKLAAERFLRLELDEQARMNKALTSGVSYGNTPGSISKVQIAGVEKGGKNRYNNIWPFEHARVKLQGRGSGCDYVNASHVKASRSNKRYIASQGPLPATYEDFWSVIWDEDVRVIVMLTAEKEGGQLKAHPYWNAQELGPLHLKLLSEKKVSIDPNAHRSRSPSDFQKDFARRRAHTTTDAAPTPPPAEQPHVVLRKFTLAHASYPFMPLREITQVHYTMWPDFGAPASPSQLLGLVEISNSIQRAVSSSKQSARSDEPESAESSRPMLVHCSAGCGRTGTFCTVDSVIDMLKRQRKEAKAGITPMDTSIGDDYMSKGKPTDPNSEWVFSQDIDLVQKTVEDFRGQRISMVQSLRQYVLCYESVLEWLAQHSTGGQARNSSRDHNRSGSVGPLFAREQSSGPGL